MFGFITRQREKAKEAHATGYELYRSLMLKAAKNGDLIAADEDRLTKVAATLGFSLERIEADAAALKDAADLDAQFAERDRLAAEHEAAQKASKDFAKDTPRVVAEYDAALKAHARKGEQLAEARRQARQKFDAAVAAGEKAAATRRRHARLFGLSDAEANPKPRAYLAVCPAVADLPADDGTRLLFAVKLLPGTGYELNGFNLADYAITPYSGQDADEFRELCSIIGANGQSPANAAVGVHTGGLLAALAAAGLPRDPETAKPGTADFWAGQTSEARLRYAVVWADHQVRTGTNRDRTDAILRALAA